MLCIFKRRIPNKPELTAYYQQLATLLSAGIPLLNSIQIMQNMQASPSIKTLLSQTHQHLLSGQPLHQFLKTHAFARQLIFIGEQIGRLDHSLNMIAEFYQKELTYKRQIKHALLYPCILCCTAILMTLCLLIFIIPRFAILFADHYADLPLITRFIFSLADFSHHHLNIAVIFFLYILFIFLPTSYAEQYRLYLQQYLFDLPVFSRLQKKILLAQFCNQLSLLYEAGIPLTDAIKLIAAMTTSKNHRHAIESIQKSLMNGQSLYQATRNTNYFTTPLPDMIQVGEQSGKLDLMLKHITSLYEDEIERTLKHLSQLLEPLIMIILGVLIGGLVIGMYLPIFKLGNVI